MGRRASGVQGRGDPTLTDGPDPGAETGDSALDPVSDLDAASPPAADSGTAPTRRLNRLNRLAVVGVTAVIVLVLDQLTKQWALSNLVPGDPEHVIWTLQLNLTGNTGAAFSLVSGQGALIAVVAIVVLVALIRMARTMTSVGAAIALGAVIGGAAGNLADRLFREGDGFLGGVVVDFIDLQWYPGIFNVADMGIVLGGIALVIFGSLDGHADS